MGLFTDDAAHEHRTLICTRARPGPRQMPVVTVFPAVSVGARTPGAHHLEKNPRVASVTGPLTGALPEEHRPFQIEAAARPLTRPSDPPQPRLPGPLSQRQDDVIPRQSQGAFLRS